jgi:hypothetical protein
MATGDSGGNIQTLQQGNTVHGSHQDNEGIIAGHIVNSKAVGVFGCFFLSSIVLQLGWKKT